MPKAPLNIDEKTIRRLTLEGRSREAIARHVGYTKPQLVAWCRNHNVPVPPILPSPDGRGPVLPEDIAERRRALRAAVEGPEEGPARFVPRAAPASGPAGVDEPENRLVARTPAQAAPAPGGVAVGVAVPALVVVPSAAAPEARDEANAALLQPPPDATPAPASPPARPEVPGPGLARRLLAATSGSGRPEGVPDAAAGAAATTDGRLPRRLQVWVPARDGTRVVLDLDCADAADLDIAITFAYVWGLECRMLPRPSAVGRKA